MNRGDVSSANTALAQEGMVFSIEPGVYLPGEMGVQRWRTWCWSLPMAVKCSTGWISAAS